MAGDSINPAGQRRGCSLALWCAAVVGLLAGQVVWLWLLRGEHLLARDGALIAGPMLMCIPLGGIAWLLMTTPAGAIRLAPRTSITLILGGTVLLQACGLGLLWPVLSEDLARYRVDGAMWLAGHSPYATTPAEFLATSGDDLDRTVAHAEMHTIYPPVSQALFALARAVEDAAVGPVHVEEPDDAARGWRDLIPHLPPAQHAMAYRALFAIFAIASAALLVAMLHRAGRSTWWAVLFAWNPLLTLEVAGSGHQDIAGVFFLLLCLALMQRSRLHSAAMALALACGIKPVIGIVLPWLWRESHLEMGFRAGRRTVLAFAASAAIIFIPPLLTGGAIQGWRQTSERFARHWEANGSLYEVIRFSFGKGRAEGWEVARAKESARMLAIVIVLSTALLTWQLRATTAASTYWILLAMLLSAPVVYPWYLLWPLALAPLLSGRAGWTVLAWSATATVSYFLWHYARVEGRWRLPGGMLAVEYIPVYLAVAIEIWLALRAPPFSHSLGTDTGTRAVNASSSSTG